MCIVYQSLVSKPAGGLTTSVAGLAHGWDSGGADGDFGCSLLIKENVNNDKMKKLENSEIVKLIILTLNKIMYYFINENSEFGT